MAGKKVPAGYILMKVKKLKRARLRRKYHVRKKVFGSPDRPRLSVFRSNKHIYAQIIDDVVGATLASASTRCKSVRGEAKSSGNKAAAERVGIAVAKQAMQVGIKCVRGVGRRGPKDRTCVLIAQDGCKEMNTCDIRR